MTTPEISVLMPVRDALATVERAARSILDQSVGSLELIAIDDRSVDGSGCFLKRLAEQDSRLRVVSNPGNGLIDALNHGLSVARGPFIARMDADDYSYPERLSQQLELFSRDPELSIVATRVRIVGGGAGYNAYERWQNSLTSHEAITREILVESPLAHPSVMLRHETLHALGGYHDRPWAEDYDLWLRAYAAGFRFAKTDAVLLEWTDHPNRASRQDPRYHERRFIECKSHYLAKTILSERPCVIWGAGRIGPMLGRFLLERGVSVRAFLDVDPRKIGSTRHGRPVLSADTHRHVDGVVLLAAVGARGARELIRREALAMNYGEGHDFFCVA